MRNILLSGLHSDADPSPGLGTARSLLMQWPHLRIEAVDYSAECTGLNEPIFAATHVLPSWAGADPDATVRTLLDLVEDAQALYLSGLDLEAQFLAERAVGRSDLLLPPTRAFSLVAKPAREAAELLGLRVPGSAFVTGAGEAAMFAAEHGWPVWVKGPRHEAHPVGDLPSLRHALNAVRATWHQNQILVQGHVDGTEESLAFAALNGELLGSCHMRKSMVSARGKTWAGRIDGTSDAELDGLRMLVAATGWSGGGEVEMVRHQSTGHRYLLEVNPRFPAWIHGAALVGVNLPALLVGTVAGRSITSSVRGTGRFVRVVREIPAGDLQPTGWPSRWDSAPRRHTAADIVEPAVAAGVAVPGSMLGKAHPSGMPSLAGRMAPPRRPGVPRSVPSQVRRSLDAAASRLAGSPTPARLLLPDVLRVRLAALRRLCTEVEAGVGVRVEVAYSVKTNPATELIGAVRQAGLLAEVISQQEVRRCLDIGFPPERLVLTGPGKWWPETGRCSVGAILCDSLHDLGHTMGLLERGRVQTGVLGVRLAPLHHRSRFGVPADEPKAFHDLRALLGGGRWDGPLGLHFHLASSRVGGKAWLREVDAVLQLAARISHDAATRVHTVDLGGGWPAAALDDGRLRWFLGAAAERVRLALPGTRRILVEPGKLIAEPSMALLATVLDIRSRHGRRAAVLDASVAELPDGTHVHPVLWKAQSRGWWRRLGPGPDELYGRLCMENDTIGHDVQLPAALAVGDTMAFLDAGAYDASMSYRFGQ